jgi:hypothetical protein
VIGIAGLFAVTFACVAEVARLDATADVWLSDANANERNTSAGKHERIKLKTIQEMAAIRFDPSAVAGREIHRATLYLRRSGDDMLRYIRISTVSQDWAEGDAEAPYSEADGATYEYADANGKRPWAWPGSQFCDVVMGSGNSLAQWAERRELSDGWVSVQIAADMVYAMVADDTDGIAIMDGGNLTYANNFLYSAQSPDGAPYIEVELGGSLPTELASPTLAVTPAPEAAHLDAGAARVTIGPVEDAFCWRVWVDGERVPRWRVPHPRSGEHTAFLLDDLAAEGGHAVRVVAVGASGALSDAVEERFIASVALPAVSLKSLEAPRDSATTPAPPAPSVRVVPPLVKIQPDDGTPIREDTEAYADDGDAVWDGSGVRLFGARGEYVSFQLALTAGDAVVETLTVSSTPLRPESGEEIGTSEVELYRVWQARNADGLWQPSYCVPIEHGEVVELADERRDASQRRAETLYVDVYLPKDAAAGVYSGELRVSVNGGDAAAINVEAEVYGFALPDRLSFWPELNAYRIPRDGDPHDYYRLAHQHRTVLNCWRWAPALEGAGGDMQVRWDEYDRDVGPLLTGEAFRDSRRAGEPVDVMYLPFADSWPTPLTEETYDYHGHWPGRGEDRQHLVDHYMAAPYIADALSSEYISAFLSVQQQFIDHFGEMGYADTEMQCFYGGKNTHRIEYGSNMWWTTDEPYHWDDWLALQFFCALWTSGRGVADAAHWPARADISRPQWQGRVLDGLVDTVYYGAGAFGSPANYTRVGILERDTGVKAMTYGSVNRDTESNTRTVAWMLNAWLHGADGVLPWQTLGSDDALDGGDAAINGGNALLVPGGRFGVPVVADMRLKALRDGQQLIEYLTILSEREGLTREQLRAAVHSMLTLTVRARGGSGVDDADSLQAGVFTPRQSQALRRALAERITQR